MEAGRKLTLAVGAAALTLIAGFEGLRQRPYLDAVQVPTVCYGHTGDDIQPRWYSQEECRAILKHDAEDAAGAVRRLARVPMAQPTFDALVSFTFNVGSGNLAKSTLLRKLNAGDTPGACAELLKWTRAGGQVLPGLVKRRQEEYKLCMQGT